MEVPKWTRATTGNASVHARIAPSDVSVSNLKKLVFLRLCCELTNNGGDAALSRLSCHRPVNHKSPHRLRLQDKPGVWGLSRQHVKALRQCCINPVSCHSLSSPSNSLLLLFDFPLYLHILVLPKMSQRFSTADVASHNKADNLWIIVDEDVYDLTKFQNEHPGGKKSENNYTLHSRVVLIRC